LELDDRTGSISARYWNATDDQVRSFQAGDFLRVKGKVQLFQGQPQLIVNNFDRCDPARVNLADFVPTTEMDVEQLMQDLRECLGRIRHPHMQAIVRAFLMDDAVLSGLRQAPAGVRNHHAYVGGLLEHIVNLLRVAERITDLYPTLDHDLLKMGILLHDIGKIRELNYDRGFSYSDEGQLIGHLVIGVEMLDDKLPIAAELLGEPIDRDVILKLKHLIVSHHGNYEYGSPKLPMIPEAVALHHLDNLDAKVHNFSRTIRDDPDAASAWTPYDPQLGRRLFKGRTGSGVNARRL
jgi:3'-5' exoribonuclease